MSISLHQNGREMNFSREKLESKFSNDEKGENTLYDIAQKPTEDKCFFVNPTKINRNLFIRKKSDIIQEWTRKAIISALEEAGKNTEKYSRPFLTFIPKKSWKSKTVDELKDVANKNGDHIANWIEQTLEWAQRISNGESWKTVCNSPDTANWYRLVVWKNDLTRIVGGSHMCGDNLSPCIVFGNPVNSTDILRFTVPLVVLYL